MSTGKGELPEDKDGFEELTPEALAHWLTLGYSQSAVARAYGYTRAYPSWMKHYYGNIPQTPREEVLAHFPFTVSADQTQTAPYKRLRDHGEYIATKGEGMNADKLSRLRGFYKYLRDNDLVLEYDPTIPPILGISNKGGWEYKVRKAADDDLLIRVNEYTDLTDRGRMIWRFPPRDP